MENIYEVKETLESVISEQKKQAIVLDAVLKKLNLSPEDTSKNDRESVDSHNIFHEESGAHGNLPPAPSADSCAATASRPSTNPNSEAPGSNSYSWAAVASGDLQGEYLT